MDIDRIEYDLKLGKIIASTPLKLANQSLTNDTSQEQEMKFEINQSETHTSTFDYTAGFSLKVGATIKGGFALRFLSV